MVGHVRRRVLLLLGAVAIAACDQPSIPEGSSPQIEIPEELLSNLTPTIPNVTDYTATATATYVWQVRYSRRDGRDRPNDTRVERFESVSLDNENGIRPGLAVTGPDDQGLWWPQLPPKPTVDDIDAGLRQNERAEPPELIKSVRYSLSFDQAGQPITLPTDHEVYRQVTKLYANQESVSVVLGPQKRAVIEVKAE